MLRNTLYFLYVFLFVCLNGMAAPIGNPSAPALLEEGFFIPDTSWSHLQTGMLQDFLLEKKFRSCKKESDSHQTMQIRGNTQTADLAWCIWERFNLQFDLGSGQFHLHSNELSGRSHLGFVWGGSAKAVVLEIKETSIAVNVQGGGWEGSGSGRKWNYRFWQGGLGVSQKIRYLNPYVGWIFNQTTFTIVRVRRFHQQILSGPYAGMTITNGLRGLVNLEWRGWYEQGLSFSFQLRF